MRVRREEMETKKAQRERKGNRECSCRLNLLSYARKHVDLAVKSIGDFYCSDLPWLLFGMPFKSLLFFVVQKYST